MQVWKLSPMRATWVLACGLQGGWKLSANCPALGPLFAGAGDHSRSQLSAGRPAVLGRLHCGGFLCRCLWEAAYVCLAASPALFASTGPHRSAGDRLLQCLPAVLASPALAGGSAGAKCRCDGLLTLALAVAPDCLPAGSGSGYRPGLHIAMPRLRPLSAIPAPGASLFKAGLRFAGTLLGGVLGLATMYFTYLCNGLTYDNHPQKFVVMTLMLALIMGTGAFLTVRFPAHSCERCCLDMLRQALASFLAGGPIALGAAGGTTANHCVRNPLVAMHDLTLPLCRLLRCDEHDCFHDGFSRWAPGLDWSACGAEGPAWRWQVLCGYCYSEAPHVPSMLRTRRTRPALLAPRAAAGYTGNSLKPDIALWRIVNTCVGVAIEMAVCATVFPVTAKQVCVPSVTAASGLGCEHRGSQHP